MFQVLTAISASLVAQWQRARLPGQATQEMWARFLGGEDPLAEEMAARSGILAWEIPWAEEPAGLQSTGSLKSWT